MKKTKLLLLGTAVALTMSSFSLSAMDITPEEINKRAIALRTCPAPQIEEAPAAQGGWFSSFKAYATKARVAVGNTLRTAGGELFDQREDNSVFGRAKTSMFDTGLAFLTTKTGIPFSSAKETICVFARKVLRTVGQCFKGGEETQTAERVFLNHSGLKFRSSDSQIQNALKKAEAEGLDAEVIANKALNRGYGTKEQMNKINVNEIRVEVLAEQVLGENQDASFETFSQNIMMQQKGREALNKMKNGQNFLEEIYKKIQIEQKFDRASKAAAAAA